MSYISEITDALIGNAICTSIVGPQLYTQIAEWEKRNIPLFVVIDSVRKARTNGNAVSCEADLCYELNQSVLRNFREWLQRDVSN